MRIAIVNPYPVHSAALGGVTRVNALVRFLARRHRVTVFAHASGNAEADGRATAELQQAGARQVLVPLPRPTRRQQVGWLVGPTPYFVRRNRNVALERALVDLERTEGLDLVHTEFAYLAPALAGLPHTVARILAEQETMSLSLERTRTLPYRARSIFEQLMCRQIRKVRRFEATVLPTFDRVFAITDEEARRLEAACPRVDVLPHVVSTHQFHPAREPESGAERVLFVGNFGHRPNVHGALWFARQVWPAIRSQVPSAEAIAVGPHADEHLRTELAARGIGSPGRVDDLAAWYRESAVFVNPIVNGAGMRGKVLEAFASGVPVVSTSLGMAGIAAQPHQHCLVADTPPAFAEGVVQYLRDPDLRRRHAARARELVVARYDVEAVFGRLELVYAEAVAARHRGAIGAIA
jgi:glycosyltransferase involved in cell wall biosynthesis